jgi:hypothetical protein
MTPSTTTAAGTAERYLELLKGCLTRVLFVEDEAAYLDYPGGSKALRESRAEGRDWPATAETMIGSARLDNLQSCIVKVLDDGVPGDLLEAGVWRGGASILMRAVLAAYGVTGRDVWVADSFRGLPPPDRDHYPGEMPEDLSIHPELAVSLATVKANFARYDLLDDRVHFLRGWFRDTLAGAPVEQLAVLRLDGDYYESTMDTLTALYPRLAPGGFLIVDDYGAIEACRQAVGEYRRDHGVDEEIVPIDWTGVYWRRRR